MAEELQQLLEKIQHDGVEKAHAESATILAKAKADADALLKDAQAKADALVAKAEQDAQNFTTRAEKTIQQAARDVIIAVQTDVTKLLTNILAKDVAAALADEAQVSALVLEAVKALGADKAEVAVAAKLAAALKAQLAAAACTGVTVGEDETAGVGFRVRLDEGRVEHDFSEAAIAAALGKRLRPELAALVQA